MLPRLAALAAAAAAGLPACAFLARRSLVIVTVHGRSMSPAFEPGDRVLVLRRRRRVPRRGGVVVLERANASHGWNAVEGAAGTAVGALRWWIKRVAAVAGDPVPDGVAAGCATRVPAAHVVVFGDAGSGGGDSRAFGFLPLGRVLGTVVLRLPRRQPEVDRVRR